MFFFSKWASSSLSRGWYEMRVLYFLSKMIFVEKKREYSFVETREEAELIFYHAQFFPVYKTIR